MDTRSQLAAQLIRHLAQLKVLNKLSGTFVNTAFDDHHRLIGMDGFTLVHMGQLKQSMRFTGSDEDFVLQYHNAMALLRRHEIISFGTIRLAVKSFYDGNALYDRWFFNIVDRACELSRQIPDDVKLMHYLDLFRTIPGSRSI